MDKKFIYILGYCFFRKITSLKWKIWNFVKVFQWNDRYHRRPCIYFVTLNYKRKLNLFLSCRSICFFGLAVFWNSHKRNFICKNAKAKGKVVIILLKCQNLGYCSKTTSSILKWEIWSLLKDLWFKEFGIRFGRHAFNNIHFELLKEVEPCSFLVEAYMSCLAVFGKQP